MAGMSAAAWNAPATAPAGSDGVPRGEGMMSIGEVLAQLRADFPDVTISKLRFLETEGLVEPRRTPAGYRKYTWVDIARLRYVLTAQRDHYLPLRVIREHLAAIDESTVHDQPAAASEASIRPTLSAVADAPVGGSSGGYVGGSSGASSGGFAGSGGFSGGGVFSGTTDAVDLRLTRDELMARAGLDDAGLRALEQHGLVTVRNGGGYDADALEVAVAAAQLAEYGLEPRHLRAYRAAADREVGLFGQLVAPMTRQQGPAGRAKAADTVRELAALTQRVHAALVRAGLRETLGR